MDTIALTYRELAERLGVKPESARKTAQRKRWHRTTGNDGTTRVHVPVEALPVTGDYPRDSHGDSPAPSQAVLDERIRALEMMLAEMRTDRDRWHAHATRPWWKRLVA